MNRKSQKHKNRVFYSRPGLLDDFDKEMLAKHQEKVKIRTSKRYNKPMNK